MKSTDAGMIVFYCPRCQTRAVRAPNTGDYEHICQGVETLQNEDVLIIGNWIDYTGSDTQVQNVLQMAGRENKLQGTRAGIEGAKDWERTSRGFRKGVHRTRQHIQTINDEFFSAIGMKPDIYPITSDKDN